MSLRLLLISFVLLLSFANEVLSYGEKEVFLVRSKHHSDGNSSCLYQKSRKQNGATILELKHRDQCCGVIKDWNKRLKNRLIADNIRVRSIQSRIINMEALTLSQAQIPITSGFKLETLNYIVTVTLGGQNKTVIVDTGSDLTWVQCQPCRLCYNQPEPLFNPSLSPSYQTVPCHSQTCKSLQSATGNSGICGKNESTCDYTVSYGDGSFSRGDLGQEQLILGGTKVNTFVFGCGRSNKGLFGEASGLMGLGRSDLSLISQTYDIFKGVFSYCLPSNLGESSGSLVFGDDHSVYNNLTEFSYTKIIQNLNPQLSSFYILNLTGTSIGGVSLKSPSFGLGNILIDSGTVISRLQPSLYKAVKTEFLEQFSGYPSAPNFSILDTCFNLSSYQEVNVPIMKMQFEGEGELIVDVTGMLYIIKSDASQVCLALASLTYEDEIAIIGNYQQRNTRVVYDTKQSKLGFAKETCSFM